MADQHLPVYLNDHFAGAQAALEILDHIESSHPDTPAGSVVKKLRPLIREDKDLLEQIMERAGKRIKSPRAVAGWLAEKMVELKLKWDDPADGSLRLLESLELLALGIDGKRALWVALQASAQRVPALAGIDYENLIQHAESQRAAVEPVRVEAARAAFAPS